MHMCNVVSYPHVSPIDDVASLKSFNAVNVEKDLISTQTWTAKNRKGPKTLLCHDMCGGYRDDRFVNGTNNPEYFNFYHWAQIDTFVYFSHHLVTIPPVMWTNLAHRNGVLSMGTFITEWDEGAVKCGEMFGSPEAAIHTAKQLTEIARTYNFDGWLVNIENKLTTEQVDNMQVFLQSLTMYMREVNKNSSVLWYDAVTTEGELVWQNRVSDLNVTFMECCNGIFLNYTWEEWHLQLSSELCEHRKSDVYTGIDVWARGCLGKFETCLSTDRINQLGLSTAIFAPGWCYEQNSGNFTQFLRDTNKFWGLLESTCVPFTDPVPLPYKSYFNYGAGRQWFEEGEVEEEDRRWFNLTKQDAPFVSFTKDAVSICWDDAWEGSTCLEIKNEGEIPDRLIYLSVEKCSKITLTCKLLGGSVVENLVLSCGESTEVVEVYVAEELEGGWVSLECDVPNNTTFTWFGLSVSGGVGSKVRVGHISVK